MTRRDPPWALPLFFAACLCYGALAGLVYLSAHP